MRINIQIDAFVAVLFGLTSLVWQQMDYRAVVGLGIVLCLLLASFSDVSSGEESIEQRRTTFRFSLFQLSYRHVGIYVHLILHLISMLNGTIAVADNNNNKIPMPLTMWTFPKRMVRPTLIRMLVWEAIRTSTAEKTFNRENVNEQWNHLDLSIVVLIRSTNKVSR